MKVAIEQLFNGTLPVSTLPAYNPDSINVGSLLGQFALSANPEDRFVGPRPGVTVRPVETSAAIPAGAVHPQTRQQLDDMVASGLLTAERSNAIKALAEGVRYSSWAEHHNIVVTARTVGLARGARE